MLLHQITFSEGAKASTVDKVGSAFNKAGYRLNVATCLLDSRHTSYQLLLKKRKTYKTML